MYALFGVALGALTRNTVAAIVGGIGWALIIENGILPGGRPRDRAKWLPTGAAVAVTSVGSAGNALLTPGVAALVLVGWAVLLAGAAARFTLTNSSAPISALDSPRATRREHLRSRARSVPPATRAGRAAPSAAAPAWR